ncbi:anion transporter [Pelosinus sp. IPA-1]|uniref:SLC13 family permease n=1 Tax=Pelosinus sp. IPA-1 TaxID=3029569 RepID=UPI0024362163|nr:anion transporter [Pelosinus sp. IPA-1]GMA97973.1 anion transporter [Pelosinus sp. IPA-1]
MFESGLILIATLIVFTVGKSPVFRVDRAGAAIIGAVLTISLGILSFDEATQAVDHRTIVVLFSMMVILANLKLAGFFEVVGRYLMRAVSTQQQLLLAVVLTSGIFSALCINDIVCLLFTPIVLLVCRHVQCNPVPHLLAVAMASNIGSAATLIGNPQNILIGSLSGLNFASYLMTAIPVALAGLLLTYLIIGYYYRKDLQDKLYTLSREVNYTSHRYLINKSLTVMTAVVVAFAAGLDIAIAASLGAAFLLITRRVNPNKIYTSVDFNLLVMFVGLFVIVGGVEHSGLMSWIIEKLHSVDFSNYGVFTIVTIILSNIVSNVPAVLLLKFFIPTHEPHLWWTRMAIFTTLAGNLTITGSFANLIVVEIAKRSGVEIGFFDYFKVGFPLTLAITIVGFLLL